MRKNEIMLPAAALEYEQSVFTDLIEHELNDIVDKLPLDSFCRAGGMPPFDSGSCDFSAKITSENDREIQILIECWFDEQISTGCSNIYISEPASGEFFVSFSKLEGKFYLVDENEAQDLNIPLPFL